MTHSGWLMTAEIVTLEHATEMIVTHPASECSGRPCPIHDRTDHVMRTFPQHWRSDRGLMERICRHGIGHPDPDQWGHFVESLGAEEASVMFVHGCDGCCKERR